MMMRDKKYKGRTSAFDAAVKRNIQKSMILMQYKI